MPKHSTHHVRGETNTLELAAVGHAINLRVYRKNHLLGRMQVGQGGLAWIPKGWSETRKRRVPWNVFAVLMKEWPFGCPKRARLKFVDGALRWRAPGKKGAGRKITWDEFVRRMEMPLPDESRPQPKAEAPEPKGTGGDPEAPKPPPDQPVPLEMPATRRLFRPAHVHNLRFLARDKVKIRLRENDSGKPPWSIDVFFNDRCQGVIGPSGYVPRPSCRFPAKRIVRELRSIERAPWRRLQEYTGETHHCGICGRQLTNPDSIARGIGPICAGV